ncbi:membrane protein FxsA [Natronococcus sp. A-GB1]|uniref:Phage T7 F exclusion suppressor FxsA n=1 Tax=Natronococcus amylolyticus DSM 10524 TaxID=1227497 RepID=L9XDG5_9EURY|nr:MULTISPECIES: FxsA family protein [Natronococcus]ELY59775.1 phage T7 F exclusion suppressor FxsA [Natronococcus amylolyticus DSM 10524]MDG5757989.1 membrane protein FxsA [Natronococcus sp. A-GB1]
MLRWILALLLIPFLDAILLGFVATAYIGWVPMVLLVVLTGLVGMLLVRAEGRRTIRKMQRSLAEGKPPTDELLDGGFLIASGAFLLTPGLVTDLIGFLLVVPLTRIPIRTALKRYVIVPYADKKTGGFASGNVWTFGFPEGSANGSEGQAQWSDGGNTYDLSEDDYSVDSEESYTVEFGDERTDSSDEDPDDPYAR